jgi:hypothetical protein
MEDRRQLRTWRCVAMALLITAMLGTVACGADDEPADDAGQRATVADTSATAADDSAQPASTPEDGRLTSPTGRVVTDFGDKADRRASVRAVLDLQRAFHAGDMVRACRSVHDFLLYQFNPAGTRPQTSCPKKLGAHARDLARRGARVRTLRLLWVRAYPGNVSGVWASDGGPHPIRVALRWEDNRWKLELGEASAFKALNAHLVGTDGYAR